MFYFLLMTAKDMFWYRLMCSINKLAEVYEFRLKYTRQYFQDNSQGEAYYVQVKRCI